MVSTFAKQTVKALFTSTVLASTSFAFAANHASASSWNVTRLQPNATYGTPALLTGTFDTTRSASDPVAVAREFLRLQRSSLKLADPDRELRLLGVSRVDSLGMTHVRFSQESRSIPVFGAELVVHIRGNTVLSMNGAFLPSVKESALARIADHEAVELARDHMQDLIHTNAINFAVANRSNQLLPDAAPELVYFNLGLLSGERSPTQLAWIVSLNRYTYVMSAITGAVLDRFDNIHDALSRTIYDSGHTSELQRTVACSEASGCTSSDADTINAWDQFADTYSYFLNTHGRDSWDNLGGELIGNVHYNTNYENAYWDGSQMVFGDNMVGLDVTAHELGHGVCQATAGLVYRWQPGALNESLSDVWGAMVDNEDWLIGEDIAIGVIRDMSNPNAYGQPMDMDEYEFYLFYDNGGVHINSGIPNYATYLASDGGSHNDVAVAGQGRSVVEQVWYRTESTRLTSVSRFSDFALNAVVACEELYGSGSSQCLEINNAFLAVGML